MCAHAARAARIEMKPSCLSHTAARHFAPLAAIYFTPPPAAKLSLHAIRTIAFRAFAVSYLQWAWPLPITRYRAFTVRGRHAATPGHYDMPISPQRY